ncbi:hypothetical protein A2U01_0052908, partial [Trifolium medium]|nr:hypothetical protein [Trifolium medium]
SVFRYLAVAARPRYMLLSSWSLPAFDFPGTRYFVCS